MKKKNSTEKLIESLLKEDLGLTEDIYLRKLKALEASGEIDPSSRNAVENLLLTSQTNSAEYVFISWAPCALSF